MNKTLPLVSKCSIQDKVIQFKYSVGYPFGAKIIFYCFFYSEWQVSCQLNEARVTSLEILCLCQPGLSTALELPV